MLSVILAGGKSTRYRSKLGLWVDGLPCVAQVYQSLSILDSEIVVVDSPDHFSSRLIQASVPNASFETVVDNYDGVMGALRLVRDKFYTDDGVMVLCGDNIYTDTPGWDGRFSAAMITELGNPNELDGFNRITGQYIRRGEGVKTHNLATPWMISGADVQVAFNAEDVISMLSMIEANPLSVDKWHDIGTHESYLNYIQEKINANL